MRTMNATAKLRLGHTDVARLGLGTNRLTNTPEHVAFVKEAVAAGVNPIDTAHTYSGGQSEETIGTALSPILDGCVIASKGGWNGGRPEVPRGEIEEPPTAADGQDRSLLSASRRSGNTARGEPLCHQGVPGQGEDQACRRLER
jgi:aryl-alcohol dehydrogenase-like predicted oxidoreductase